MLYPTEASVVLVLFNNTETLLSVAYLDVDAHADFIHPSSSGIESAEIFNDALEREGRDRWRLLSAESNVFDSTPAF
jgi:arginase family enzyme